ncbi:MAG: hypothetical protein CL610_20115 [Anaerolineaceae bacterium]|nr:hypothetical protein [Anaerolineaceae bacterium]
MQDQKIGRVQLLRDLNYRAVFELIAQTGAISRVEVANQLTLSQPSVSRIVDTLLQANLVLEGNRVASKAGRRQTLLDINPEAALVAGLSIRRKYIRILIADLKGNPIMQEQVERDTTSLQALITQIRQLLDEKTQLFASPLVAVCVGILGSWDSNTHKARSIPLGYLDGVNLEQLLKEALTDDILDDAIGVENDVNYAALGEYMYGAAQETNSFFYTSVGSGVGGGLVVHGKLHTGFQGFAGEISFLPITSEWKALEELISFPGIERHARSHGLDASAEQVLELARSGDAVAQDIIQTICNYFALAMCSIITVVNPEIIVIGGMIGRYNDVLIPHIEKRLVDFVPRVPRIVGTALEDNAAQRGAVARALELARAGLITRHLS